VEKMPIFLGLISKVSFNPHGTRKTQRAFRPESLIDHRGNIEDYTDEHREKLPLRN
jgi:hypothetical protein